LNFELQKITVYLSYKITQTMADHTVEDKRFSKILSIIIGLIFIGSGLVKILGLFPYMKATFDAAELPSWFYYGISALEMVAGGMLFTKFRKVALFTLAALMAGAIYTHLKNQDAGILLIPSILCAVFIAIEIVSEFKNDDQK
jgi:uncharacterized membrane protein YphA (DoxX/SURF4 family)